MYDTRYVCIISFLYSLMQNDDSNGTYMNWLYDLYAPAVGSSVVGNGRFVCY